MKLKVVALSALMASLCLHADELSDMKKDIEVLKKEVAELQSLIPGGVAQNAASAIDRKAEIRRRYEEDKKDVQR